MPHNTSPLGRRSTRAVPSRRAERVPPLELLRIDPQAPEDAEEIERALLDFDVDADIAAIIPMPPTIPLAVRAAITRALGDRFQDGDDALNDWLHSPNESLAGATPFERVVAGDGIAVLTSLLGPGEHPELRELVALARAAGRPPLHLLR